MELLFATGNKHKFTEAAAVLGKACGITLKHFQFSHREIRSDSLDEIAREAVEAAYEATGRAGDASRTGGTGLAVDTERKPVFVEDSGLFINALKGFPGPYSAWVQEKLGNQGILRLLEGVPDRSAYFEACIAYHDGRTVRTFHGKCPGSIAPAARGSSGFGYDPIFVPEGHPQTFAENIELKNNISHRYKSLLEFSKLFKIR